MLIEIIRVPNGPAPEKVRREWVGLRMDAQVMPANGSEVDFTTNKPIGNRGGCIVKTDIALRVLGKKSKGAAEWFRRNIPAGLPWLSFGPDEIKIISEKG